MTGRGRATGAMFSVLLLCAGATACLAGGLDASGNPTPPAAPAVRIDSPRSGLSVRDSVVDFVATVSDRGGGIGRVEWRLNGRDYADFTEPSGGEETLRRSFALEAGANTIEIVAHDSTGAAVSLPARVEVVLRR